MTDRPETFTEQLLTLAGTYAEAEGIELAVLSRRALGDSKSLPAMASGSASITLQRAERLVAFLSDRWPDALPWPEGVARPSAKPPSVPSCHAHAPAE